MAEGYQKPLSDRSKRAKKGSSGRKKGLEEKVEEDDFKDPKHSHFQESLTIPIVSDHLDCPICQEPLQPPITQCPNGHQACRTYVKKLVERCPTCKLTTGQIRNLGLEAMVESARVRCSFWDLGCRASVCYYDKLAHEAGCIHASCFCPIPGCAFMCHYSKLAAHVKDTHRGSAFFHRINLTSVTKVPLRPEDSLVVLERSGSSDYVHLLVKSSKHAGSFLAVVCLQPRCLKSCEYEYELAVTGNGCTLQLTTRPTNVVLGWER